MNSLELWARYQQYLCIMPQVSLTLDISRMRFDDSLFEQMAPAMEKALAAMDALENGAIANASESRQVGHYWLRAPELAPDPTITNAIQEALKSVKQFAAGVHDGIIRPQRGDAFSDCLFIGIGGSSLGAQLITEALATGDEPLIARFLDNTDPNGIRCVLAEWEEALEQTMVVVVSKSGGTRETLNTLAEVEAAYRKAGLSLPQHAVAITGESGMLRERAAREKWLATFPLWDWVGGRTSATSPSGLLPAALIGADVDALLDGARACDVITRGKEPRKNPAALLAMMWYHAGAGVGDKNMVVLPYRDHLERLGRYLQQLVMESIGKRTDRTGKVVHQGLSVFGNKGSSDQHALLQQLCDGRADFFATFVRVLTDDVADPVQVEPGVTCGDYLSAFWQGTRDALTRNDRESITLTLHRLDARSLGALIALFERAVGLYAELINVNAYDQPGVERSKQNADSTIALQEKLMRFFQDGSNGMRSAEEIASAIGRPGDVEAVHHLLEHAVANKRFGLIRNEGDESCDVTYGRSVD